MQTYPHHYDQMLSELLLFLRAEYNYVHIHLSATQQLLVRLCLHSFVSFSIGFHPGELNYSLKLQRHTGQTMLLQALALGYMRSNEYSTTKIFVNNYFMVDIVDKVN